MSAITVKHFDEPLKGYAKDTESDNELGKHRQWAGEATKKLSVSPVVNDVVHVEFSDIVALQVRRHLQGVQD